MKLISIILLMFFFSFSNKSILHPVHISVTNIDYNETEEVFNLSIKLFANDFEKVINKNYKATINLGKEKEIKDCNKLIDKYIIRHFIFKVANRNLIKNIRLLKKIVKLEDNSIWLFYKIKYSKKSLKDKKIELVNILINDLYNDQKNLVIFTCLNTKEGYDFDKSKIKFEFFIK